MTSCWSISPSELVQKNLVAPYKTKNKTRYSEEGVEKALRKIIKDEGEEGTRPVDIKYRRRKFSVTIEYTFQDR